MRRWVVAGVLLASLLGAAPSHAAPEKDHLRGAGGGAIAGLVCGGMTLTYSKLRAGSSESSPLLWHDDSGPGWITVFFAEHAIVGGATGAFGDGPRQGFVIGGLVTCGLDLLYVISSEILSFNEEPSLALIQGTPAGWRLGVPPVVVNRRGAWVSVFALRF